MTDTIDGGDAGTAAALGVEGGGTGSAFTRTVDGGNAGRSWSTAPPPTPMLRAAVIAPERLRVIRQGDPRLIMGPDGTRIQWTEGQPLMDEGLENTALISLFTRKGWCGNKFMKSAIGSDFEEACDAPITRQSLNRIRMAAEDAMKRASMGDCTVEVTNPDGYRLSVGILAKQSLSLTRTAGAWSSQAVNPAYPRIT